MSGLDEPGEKPFVPEKRTDDIWESWPTPVLAAARLAGKIEGLKMAARICDATWDDEDAAKAIRAKIAELEATTTPASPGSSDEQ